MKKWIFLLLAAGIFIYFYACRSYWFLKPRFSGIKIENVVFQEAPGGYLVKALEQLKARQDEDAWLNFEKALKGSDSGLDALWGEAELLRRKRKYDESEEVLKKILSTNPNHALSLVTLSYIKYNSGKFNEAEKLLSSALDSPNDKESAAAAYVMLGAVNAARAEKGNIIEKLMYAPQVKCYFDRAVELAPGLAEAHLALGTFYLLAPGVLGGGNLDKASVELNLAVNLAPGFATANARLAQCYKKQYDYVKYNFYREIAEKVDPDNEVLKGAGVR